MAENPSTASSKTKWPQLANGTTDWDKVFDDPSSGLIHAISQATSAEALRAVTLLVIQKLFTRDEDKAEVSAFTATLDGIIEKVEGDEQLAATIDAVAQLLTQIKEERQEKAREYLKAQGKKKKKGERRSKRKKKKPGFEAALLKFMLALTKPKVWIPIGVVGVLAIFGAILFVVAPMLQGEDTEVAQPATQGEKGAAPQTADGKTPEVPAEKTDEELDAEEEAKKWVRPVIITPTQWPIIQGSKGKAPVLYASLFYVSSSKGVSAICGALPRVRESLLVAFSSAKLGSRQPNAEELRRITVTTKNLINKSLGPAVRTMVIVPYGDKRFLATNTPPCRLSR